MVKRNVAFPVIPESLKRLRNAHATSKRPADGKWRANTRPVRSPRPSVSRKTPKRTKTISSGVPPTSYKPDFVFQRHWGVSKGNQLSSAI